MTANVALTDTFGTFKDKSNEVIVMTQVDGMDNFIKLLDTTQSTSNTTGSIITAGGVAVKKSAYIGENLTVEGNIHSDGNITADGNITLGDAATDNIVFSADINSHIIPNTDDTFDLGSTGQQWRNLYLNGTANLDIVDIDGAVQIDAAVTVGVDGTGYDVKFFGDQAGTGYMLWDQSTDDLILGSDSKIGIGTTTPLANFEVSDSVSSSAAHPGIASFRWQGAGAGVGGQLWLGRSNHNTVGNYAAVDAADVLGQINFVGTDGGSDAFWTSAAIRATAAETWTAPLGSTEEAGSYLTFHTTDIGTNNLDERMRITDAGNIGIGNTGPASKLHVTGTVQVGVDNVGHNVVFYGATAGSNLTWDQAADALEFTDSTPIRIGEDAAGDMTLYHDGTNSYITNKTGALKLATETSGIAVNIGHGTSEVTIADNLTVAGDLTVTGTTIQSVVMADKEIEIGAVTTPSDTTANLGGLRLKGATDKTITWTNSLDSWVYNQGITVGATTDGHDVKFWGTSGANYWLWDESDDSVKIVGHQYMTGSIFVGVDGTGHDVKFFGDSAGAFMIYDQSEDTLEVRGPSADATTSTGKLLLSTALTDINDADVIGRIDFKAPLEAGGTDAIKVGASIWAEADATFSASVNSTDLVFATGDSDTATEKFRIDSTGQATFADGAIDVDIASHDGTNGLKLGGTLITTTAALINTATQPGDVMALAIALG